MKPIKLDKKPLLPEGWEIEEDNGQTSFVPDFALHLEPEQEKGRIAGNTLRERLKGKPVLNANVLDYLLAHPELIPEDWKGKYVFFWGTIYRNSGGNLCVRYLYWRDGWWAWGRNWLDRDFNGYRPAALRASPLPSALVPPTSSDTMSLEKRVEELEAWRERVRQSMGAADNTQTNEGQIDTYHEGHALSQAQGIAPLSEELTAKYLVEEI